MGMPGMDEKMQRDIDLRRIELGGCMVSPGQDPRWHCLDCGAYFGLSGERAPDFSVVSDHTGP